MAINEKQNPGFQDVKSRKRWAGFNVALSVVVAAALLVVVNVAAYYATKDKPLRKNFETLGRYRLSDTAQRILDQLKTPVKITTIYTSTDPERKPEEYLPPLRDLLDEMHQRNNLVTVVAVGSDTGKAEIINRLREQLEKETKEHRQVIADFLTAADIDLPLLEQFAQTWREYPTDGWLAQFNVPKSLETITATTIEDLRKLTNQTRSAMGQSTLPDYSEMVGNITDAISKIKTQRLAPIRTVLRDLAALPERAEKLRPELNKNLQALQGQLNQAVATLSQATSATSQPGDIGEALSRFTAMCRKVSVTAEAVARNLDTLAEGEYVKLKPGWRVEGLGELPDLYRNIAHSMLVIGEQAQGIKQHYTPEKQAEAVTELRNEVPKLVNLLKTEQASVDKLLADLTKRDEATTAIFERVKQENFFEDIIGPLGSLLDRAGKLPAIATQTDLIDRLKQDNIVLVEAPDNKLGVVTFDEAWPVADKTPGESNPRDAVKRVFYGDMAVSSKLLNLTRPPLAEVVFAFFEDVPPQQMWQQQHPLFGAIPMMALSTLRERLVRANLEVTEWNINKQKTPPAPKDGRRQVLIVLPFPWQQDPSAAPDPKRPQVTPADMEQVTKLIESGTPAIFLAGYSQPQYPGGPPPMYEWNEYLSQNWSIGVRGDQRVLRAERDPDNPGKFTLPLAQWSWMPVSTFTHNPIGNPLRARRFYWMSASPIMPVRHGNPAIVEDILYVPAGMEGVYAVWATPRPDRILAKLQGGQGDIAPESEDIRPPFGLITESRRQINGKDNSIILMGIGMSFFDDYLTQRIPEIKGQSVTTEPPPTGDVDVVINSAYYLSGNQQYIGAGPVLVQPIDCPRADMLWIQILFAGVWPAVMLLAGGLVMLWRIR